MKNVVFLSEVSSQNMDCLGGGETRQRVRELQIYMDSGLTGTIVKQGKLSVSPSYPSVGSAANVESGGVIYLAP